VKARLSETPRVVLIYGLLGLSGFFGPPLVGVMVPAYRDAAMLLLIAYAALILSFLGGARWGAAVQAPAPSPRLIGLTMLPSIAAWLILLLPANMRAAQFIAFAGMLAGHLGWDLRTKGLPGWYGQLRVLLTVGAVVALAWQAALQG